MRSWTQKTFRFKCFKKENVCLFLFISLFTFTFSTNTFAIHFNSSWTGSGDGVNWNDPDNWNSTNYPDNGGGDTYDANIQDDEVDLNVSVNINDLVIGFGSGLGTLNINSGITLTLPTDSPPAFVINDTLNFDGIGAQVTRVYVSGLSGETLDVTGNGTINVTDTGTRNEITGDAGTRINFVDLTINVTTGRELNLGVNSIYITNQSLMTANGGKLDIDPGAGTNGVINTNGGIIQAENSGTSNFFAGYVRNIGGTIQALTSSSVLLNSTGTIEGGTLASSGGGVIRNLSLWTLDATGLMIINGDFETANAASTHITGTITNNGNMIVDSTASLTRIFVDADTTINGTGNITLDSDRDNTQIYFTNASGDTLTLDGTVTAQGRGNIGVNRGGITVEDNATISANVSGQTLTLDVSASDGGINTGNIKATGGGILSIAAGAWNQNPDAGQDGTITAETGSTVNTSSGTFSGGVLQTQGTGSMNFNGSNEINSGVTLAGSNLIVGNGGNFNWNGANTLNGTLSVSLNGNSSSTNLNFINGDGTVNGTGSLLLADNQSRVTDGDTSGSRVTFASGVDVTGQGNLGINELSFTLNGSGVVVDANVNGGTLIIDPYLAGSTNEEGFVFSGGGTARASNGSTLTLNAGGYNGNGTGTLLATGTDSVLNITSSSLLKDITVAAESNGTVNIIGPVTARDVVFDGDITVNSGAVLTAESTMTINDTVEVPNTVASLTTIQSSGNLLITGSGTGAKRLYLNDTQARLNTSNNTDVITIDSGFTVDLGAGDFLVNSGGAINNGLVTATSGTASAIDPGSGQTFDNNGTVRADTGATLTLITGTYDNTGGTVETVGTGVLVLSGATLTGGTLAGSNITSTNSTIGGGMSLTGNVTVASTTNLNVSGALNGAGDISIPDVTSLTSVILEDGAALNVDLSLGDTQARLNTVTATDTVSVGGDLTGFGNIGASVMGNLTVTTGGSITSNVSGQTLTIDPSNTSGSFTLNSGANLTADNGSTLVLAPAQAITINGDVLATNSGKISITATNNITGNGNWTINTGEIEIGAITVGTGTSGSLTVNSGGTLDLNGTTFKTHDANIKAGATLEVASGLEISGDFTFSLTDETAWGLDGPTAELTMTGGVGATAVTSYANLEIGGEDYGTDPAPGTVVGAAAGFVDNFDLTKLVIGVGAKVNLVDLVDNGNRIEHGFGTDEALYVETLEFLDTTSKLNLNGLHLYYTSIIGDAGQIEDTPVVFTDWTDGVNDAGTPFDSGVVGTLPAFEMDWTGVGDITTSGDATILAVGSPAALPGDDWAYVMTAGGDEVVYSITPTTAVTSGSFNFTIDTAGLVLPNGQDLAGLFLYKDGVELFPATSVDGTEVTFLVTSTFSEFGIAANPEPTTLFLIGTGLLGLLPLRRKK